MDNLKEKKQKIGGMNSDEKKMMKKVNIYCYL